MKINMRLLCIWSIELFNLYSRENQQRICIVPALFQQMNYLFSTNQLRLRLQTSTKKMLFIQFLWLRFVYFSEFTESSFLFTNVTKIVEISDIGLINQISNYTAWKWYVSDYISFLFLRIYDVLVSHILLFQTAMKFSVKLFSNKYSFFNGQKHLIAFCKFFYAWS